MIRLAIFASGNGTNAENLARFFASHERISIVKIYCNKPNAGVLARAESLGIPTLVFNKDELRNGSIAKDLKDSHIDYIVLAGFLLLIPQHLVQAFPRRIINIHPALLPSYGGKGMYGSKVHEAVIANNEANSGITIHLVDEVYDRGEIIFQKSLSIAGGETPDSLASKIHELEYQYFPKTVEAHILRNGK